MMNNADKVNKIFGGGPEDHRTLKKAVMLLILEAQVDVLNMAQKHFESKRDAIHVPNGYFAVEGAMAEQDSYDRAADYCAEQAADLRANTDKI